MSLFVFQTDLKKLLRNPPSVKVPKTSGIHPMLGALPSSVREPLASNSKEMMKLRGLTLYKEGSKPNGIWLVSSGVVKVRQSFYTINLYDLIFHVNKVTLTIATLAVGKQYNKKQAFILSHFHSWKHIGSV